MADDPLEDPPDILETQELTPLSPPHAHAKAAKGDVSSRARRVDRDPRLLAAARRLREILPGDAQFGDPLSTAGSKQSDLAARRLTQLTEERPGVLREVGLSALQVWQSFSESQGRGRGEEELAIAFTDLVEFSAWALEAGDDTALQLLRDVGRAIEPPVLERGGRVVKRLGDGMMAVFLDPAGAVDAILEGIRRLDGIEHAGYKPQIRAGVHYGRPRKLGGDYLGVDVNIAARVAEAAGGGELLVSDRVLEALDQDVFKVRRKRFFRVKGVPDDVTTFSVSPR